MSRMVSVLLDKGTTSCLVLQHFADQEAEFIEVVHRFFPLAFDEVPFHRIERIENKVRVHLRPQGGKFEAAELLLVLSFQACLRLCWSWR